MNEAYDPNGTASAALLSLRLIAGKGETEGVIDMYAQAARIHGACPSDTAMAIAEGREDRAKALVDAERTLFTVDEILADIHADLVESRRRVIGIDRGTQYLVCDEHTLCYQQPGSVYLGILGSDIHGRSWLEGTTLKSMFRQIRDATVEDFKRFRVSPLGHIAR